jgi:hypothetical protein
MNINFHFRSALLQLGHRNQTTVKFRNSKSYRSLLQLKLILDNILTRINNFSSNYLSVNSAIMATPCRICNLLAIFSFNINVMAKVG